MNTTQTTAEIPYVLRAYAAGQVTWREAAFELNVQSFIAFETLLAHHGIALYEPEPIASRRKMDWIDAILDEDS